MTDADLQPVVTMTDDALLSAIRACEAVITYMYATPELFERYDALMSELDSRTK